MRYKITANTNNGTELEVLVDADNLELAKDQFLNSYDSNNYSILNVTELDFGIKNASPEVCDHKLCPQCAESIKSNAVVCRFCGFSYNKIASENIVKKITTSHGVARGCLSFIIPGLGQIANGEIGLGIAFFILAIIVGAFTFGIGGFVIAIIAAVMCKPIFECGNCRMKVEEKAKCCPACKSKFE